MSFDSHSNPPSLGFARRWLVLPPEDIWGCLKTFVVVSAARVLVAPRMGGDQSGYYTSYNEQDSPQQQRIIQPQIAIVLKVNNFALSYLLFFTCNKNGLHYNLTPNWTHPLLSCITCLRSFSIWLTFKWNLYSYMWLELAVSCPFLWSSHVNILRTGLVR